MGWEWVAPLATLIAGGIGMFFTYMTARRQQESQLQLLLKEFEYSRNAELHNEKKAVYSSFYGLCSTCLIIAQLVKQGRHAGSAFIRAKTDISPDDPRYQGILDETLKSVVEDTFGIKDYRKFAPSSLDEILTLASRIYMIGSPEVAKATVKVVSHLTNYIKLNDISENNRDLVENSLNDLLSGIRRDLNLPDLDERSIKIRVNKQDQGRDSR